jgi:hypothetical protein
MAYWLGMYLRITERRNRDGSTVTYYALAESVWNPEAKRPEARVVPIFYSPAWFVTGSIR